MAQVPLQDLIMTKSTATLRQDTPIAPDNPFLSLSLVQQSPLPCRLRQG